MALHAEMAGLCFTALRWPHRISLNYRITSDAAAADLRPIVCPVLLPRLCHPLTVPSAHHYRCRDNASATEGCHQLCNCSPVVRSAPCVALKSPWKAQKNLNK